MMDNETRTTLDQLYVEARKRNDLTYGMLVRLLETVPDVEGDMRRAVTEAEAHQQACRKALIRLGDLLRQSAKEGW